MRHHLNRSQLLSVAAALLAGTLSPLSARAENSKFVLTAARDCQVRPDGTGDAVALERTAAPIPHGAIHLIGPDSRLMATDSAGHVVIVAGPALFELHPVTSAGSAAASFRLRDGSFQFHTADAPADPSGQVDVIVEGLRPGSDEPYFAIELARGQVYVQRTADGFQAAYASSAGGTLAVAGLGAPLRAGELATWDAAGGRVAPGEDWIRQNVNTALGAQLCEATALAQRQPTARGLFNQIIEWDQYGRPEVVTQISTTRFAPEFRAVSFSVGSVIRPISGTGARQVTAPFFGANEVPPLSPAALAVANIVDGQTAIDLNRDARALLTQTGSQGLGFGGLRQLAIPGIFGGIRTLGPAGLGVEKIRR